MDVHVYTLEARDRAATPYPESDYWTYDYAEAKERAQAARLMVIDNTYTFEDSESVDDFTGCDSCRYCGATVLEESPGGLWGLADEAGRDAARYCDPAPDHMHAV